MWMLRCNQTCLTVSLSDWYRKLWIGLWMVLTPLPVSGTWHLCWTRFLSNHFEVINFCGRCASIWQLLHKVNVVWNNCFRKILKPDTYKWYLADFQKPFSKKATNKRCTMHFHSKQDNFPSLYPGSGVYVGHRLLSKVLLYTCIYVFIIFNVAFLHNCE